jgi:hypothetical protein
VSRNLLGGLKRPLVFKVDRYPGGPEWMARDRRRQHRHQMPGQ